MTLGFKTYGVIKAAFDITVASILIVSLLPLFLIVAVVVSFDGGPVFFRHRRLGQHGQPFKVVKFRTMCVDADRRLASLLGASSEARKEWEATRKLRNDPRVTRVGQFLRRTSLDELPQLLNVLRGEMSLVGPRPIVAEEASNFGRRLDDILSVKPGITGLWQVSGRSDISYLRRVALEAIYARHRNAILDLYILLLTPAAVLRARGAY